MVRNASLITVVKIDKKFYYLVQVREANRPEFNPGEYPFIFPGACSLFGGALEENEDAKKGFERELQEELPGVIFSGELKHRCYNWKKQTKKILEKANSVFNKNVNCFLGFNMNDLVPQCALGKNRGKTLTYSDWISMTEEDHFYIGEIELGKINDLIIKEGKCAVLIPHQAIKSLIMVPTDKLAILDDLMIRIEAGEIEI